MTTLDYLEKLLAFDTTSAHPNIELIAWVQAQLEAMGAVVQVIANADGSKANLFATIGPADRGGYAVWPYRCSACGRSGLDFPTFCDDLQRR
tara:strand:- start:860 stop:1135 length:276 start_codon:yes stop_codon:yes gene_type:complete